MDLNALFLFVKVVDKGGISAAARALRMPKSTLSNRILKLESELGARLIQRSSRRFAVTDVGREVYGHAAAMLLEAEAAARAVKVHLEEPAGTVRISSSIGTSHAGLASVLAQFASEFAEVRVIQQTTNRNVDLIEEGIDLAVRAHQDPLPDSNLVQRRLGFSPRWLIAAPAYLAQAGTPREAADLARHAGLSMSAMARDAEWSLQGAQGGDVRVRVSSRFSADDPQLLLAATTRGLGIAVLPAGICRAHIATGRLVHVLPHWFAGGADISMLIPHRRGLLPAVRVLTDFIAHHLPGAMGLIVSGNTNRRDQIPS